MKELLANISWHHLFWSVVFLILGIVLWKLVDKGEETFTAKFSEPKEQSIKRQAAIKRVSNLLRAAILTITALVVLQINGINVSSILASLGIAGALAGLAWQDMFKDLIQGARILSDGMLKVGDYVVFKDKEYQIVDFSMRTTRMKSLLNNDVLVVCNREITSISKMSGEFYISLGLSYSDDSDRIDEVLTDCAKEIKELKRISKCEYLGLREFDDSSIRYQFLFKCSPGHKYSNYRAAMRIIRKKLVEAEIEIPFNQLDIHEK